MRVMGDSGNWGDDGERRAFGRRATDEQGLYGQRPGEALIVGGFGARGDGHVAGYSGRGPKRRSTARIAAPLAVPVALGLTLGIILAVSSGPARTHITQSNSGNSSSSAPVRPPKPAGP
jgi:hypothetical protein